MFDALLLELCENTWQGYSYFLLALLLIKTAKGHIFNIFPNYAFVKKNNLLLTLYDPVVEIDCYLIF